MHDVCKPLCREIYNYNPFASFNSEGRLQKRAKQVQHRETREHIRSERVRRLLAIRERFASGRVRRGPYVSVVASTEDNALLTLATNAW